MEGIVAIIVNAIAGAVGGGGILTAIVGQFLGKR
jgi:hypothetical protein